VVFAAKLERRTRRKIATGFPFEGVGLTLESPGPRRRLPELQSGTRGAASWEVRWGKAPH